jgi:hypothetical protein
MRLRGIVCVDRSSVDQRGLLGTGKHESVANGEYDSLNGREWGK